MTQDNARRRIAPQRNASGVNVLRMSPGASDNGDTGFHYVQRITREKLPITSLRAAQFARAQQPTRAKSRVSLSCIPEVTSRRSSK